MRAQRRGLGRGDDEPLHDLRGQRVRASTCVPAAGANPPSSPRRTAITAHGRPALAAAIRSSRRADAPSAQCASSATSTSGPGHRRVDQPHDGVGQPVGAVLRVELVDLGRAGHVHLDHVGDAAGPSAAGRGRPGPGRRAAPGPSPPGCPARARAAGAPGRGRPGRRWRRRTARRGPRRPARPGAASTASDASRDLPMPVAPVTVMTPPAPASAVVQGLADRRQLLVAAEERQPRLGGRLLARARAPRRPRRPAAGRPCPSSGTGPAGVTANRVRECSRTAGWA